MSTRKLAAVALLLLATVCAALQFDIATAADGDQYVGTWKGTPHRNSLPANPDTGTQVFQVLVPELYEVVAVEQFGE